MRHVFYSASFFVIGFYVVSVFFAPAVLWSLVLVGPLLVLGFYDIAQKKRTIRRNFPIIGRFRYLFEMIRPEIYQYFIESDNDGRPLSRERRSLVYQRAKGALDTVPFGTKEQVYHSGYEWVNHSICPVHYSGEDLRVKIGSSLCSQPYSASIFNISAMSYGALSRTAVESLSKGASKGGFAMNTGEGGISPYHLKGGADLIWQIGTGYFGCRNNDGSFNKTLFQKYASQDQVKMIEIKISQGAKPGHGGILPKEKLTPEIAEIRHVPLGEDVLSPPGHSEFSTPFELLDFIKRLRELSGGKPVGIKLCIGKRRQFLALCKAMLITKIYPDFITVDGGEGGTGAAPLEFSNHVGCPLVEGLVFVHNCLKGFSLRKEIKVIATTGVISGFDLIHRLSIGADACYAARGMMLAIGCIQALRCNSNHCPAGVATQNPELYKGLDVTDKSERTYLYHHNTIRSVGEILGAMGLHHSKELRPWHIMRRINETDIRHYGEIYNYLNDGDLLKDELPKSFERAMNAASPDSF